MSLKITCPNCGSRPLQEFVYGEILAVPESITDPEQQDVDRAFMHNNPEGPTTERWFHTYGCRRWLTVERDTSEDVIIV